MATKEEILKNLNTSNKTSLISAINEVNTKTTTIEQTFDTKVMEVIQDNGGMGSSYKLKGSAQFNSITGTIVNHTIGNTDYEVKITPTANPNGYLGEVWVEKAANSFSVKCSGTTNVTFSYVVF